MVDKTEPQRLRFKLTFSVPQYEGFDFEGFRKRILKEIEARSVLPKYTMKYGEAWDKTIPEENITFEFNVHSGYYDDFECEMIIYGWRLETPEEVEDRLKKNAELALKRKEAALKAKQTKLEKERKEYERLAKKFGDM